MADVGIFICSRRGSTRIPDKPFVEINGVSIVRHLVSRLQGPWPICVGVPEDEKQDYVKELTGTGCYIFGGHESDPLARMAMMARQSDFEYCVRVNHDKIFMNWRQIIEMVERAKRERVDYLYSSSFVPGTGFEVIRNSVLQKAAEQFVEVEHIGYAIRSVTKKVLNVSLPTGTNPPRLLIDYPQDLTVIKRVVRALGNYCTQEQAIHFIEKNPSLKRMNAIPRVTIYTCAFNAEKYIRECVHSVLEQNIFNDCEYIVVDDKSADRTVESIPPGFLGSPNTWIYCNKENIGLSSSSNFALDRAKSDYIIRLDADDYFVHPTILAEMLEQMREGKYDVLYPHYYDGNTQSIRHGGHRHHAGGALFNTHALRYIKFTDGLRHHDSFDVWTRLKGKLSVGYFDRPAFFYRHTPGSMSRGSLSQRRRIKKQIEARNAN